MLDKDHPRCLRELERLRRKKKTQETRSTKNVEVEGRQKWMKTHKELAAKCTSIYIAEEFPTFAAVRMRR